METVDFDLPECPIKVLYFVFQAEFISWNPRSHSDLTLESFEKVLQEANQIEVLLIGTGEKLVPLNNELRTIFREKRIMADTMSTGAAIRTYNVLLAENRAVATSLIAVD